MGLFPQFPGGGGCGDVDVGFAFITGGSVQLSWVGMLFNQKGWRHYLMTEYTLKTYLDGSHGCRNQEDLSYRRTFLQGTISWFQHRPY